MLSRLPLALVLLLIAISSSIAKERVWTSTDGRTMRAEFVRELDGEVTFLKDGKIITLQLDRLSPRDQQTVRDLAAGKTVPEDAVPVLAPPVPAAEKVKNSSDSPSEAPSAEASPAKPLVTRPVPIESRTWTDVFGNQVTGKYVRIFGSNVVLLRGGKSVTVKFYELSSEDQAYLRELLTSRGQEGLIPPKVDPNASTSSQPVGGAETPEGNTPPGIGNSLPASSAPPADFSQPPGGAGFPGSVGSPPIGGAGGFTGPGGAGFPGGGGSAFPPSGPPNFPPQPGYEPPAPPGFSPPGYSPPGVGPGAFPSAPPPAMPGSSTGPGSSSLDRFNQQMEESRRQQLESIQRMQDQMNQRHESLFNRHGSTGECLNCKHSLNDAEMRRSACPYCGVTWDYEIDEYGNKRQLNNSSFSAPFSGGNNAGANSPAIDAKSARMIGLAVGVFIGLVVVAGMVIGTIYIIMSIASASSSSQQRHYR